MSRPVIQRARWYACRRTPVDARLSYRQPAGERRDPPAALHFEESGRYQALRVHWLERWLGQLIGRY